MLSFTLLGALAPSHCAALAAASRGAAAYLVDGGGARPLGMGNASAALSNEASGVYFNPAGLGFQRRAELQTMVSPQDFEQRFWSAEYAQPLGAAGTMAAATLMREIRGIQGRQNEFDLPTRIESLEGAVLMGYGKSLGDSWSVGATGKYLFHRFSGLSDNARGYGIDLGLQYRCEHLRGLSLGVAVHNVAGTLSWSTGKKEPLPPAYKLGAGYRPLEWLLVALDVDAGENLRSAVHAGAEMSYRIVDFRLGVNRTNPTAGFGLTVLRLRIDYAMELDLQGQSDVNRLGVGFRF